MPVVYRMQRYPTKFDVSVFSKVSSRLPPSVQDNVLSSRDSAMVFLLRSAFSNKNHRAVIFFTVHKVKFLREMVWASATYQYWKKMGAEGKEEGFFWKWAESMYQHGLKTSSFAKGAAEVQHRGYVITERSGTFARAPKKALQSLHCPRAVSEKQLGGCLRLTHSTFEGEEMSRKDANRLL